MKQIHRLRSFKQLSWLILLIAFFYLVAGYFWKRAFVFGEVQGIYWMLIALDWSVLPLTIICLLGFIFAFAVLIIQLIRRQPELQSRASRVGILFISSLMFVAASFPLLITPSIPLDSISIRRQVYYLSLISTLVDINYCLYECDNFGIICRQIYRSSDYSSTNPSRAQLVYSTSSDALSINLEDQGDIYSFTP
jgi:hypothetical protein